MLINRLNVLTLGKLKIIFCHEKFFIPFIGLRGSSIILLL
jgi:hypothetical protein